ncbi:MAG TPA: PP2C family protein-serine/threonine phosphatase [Acidobacteriaceae bacterium]|jgi:serine phosphatase RsbU (regulator of sigma subunit)|nr:PP2C family protein-serine/threonine phosphatase [Acidobacteriaceae bacterium]
MAEPTFSERVHRFWQRVTEGMQLNDLWRQFHSDARSSYRLYSKDVDAARPQGESKGRHVLHVAGQFFWAVLDKLTPARRILLLLALVLLVLPIGNWTYHSGSTDVATSTPDFQFLAALLLLALLIMEVGDRVVMKRDLQIAKEIQAWLLPATPPPVPGLEIAFTTRPANTVAGDYYDVFPRPGVDGESPHFLIAVADVAGKSVPAAMLMATFQASLKTLSGTPGPLTELVARINRYACSNSQNGRRFTTAFVAEYDPAMRRLTYVNAGHNNPILLRKSGAVERLDVGGIPVGVLDAAAYASAEVTLEAGDWLVAFTDGVVEAENNAQAQYGEDRLLTMMHWGAQLPPALLLSHLFADIDRFVEQAPQHDDITCMLLRAV